jgi:Planctomycete cytochrome C
MRKRSLTVACVVIAGLSLAGTTAFVPVRQACAQTRGEVSYKEDIVPIFKGWCISCHEPGGEGYKASGVDLTSYAGLMKGTKYGAVVVPNNPDGSTLIALIYGRTSPKIRMPFGHKPLPDCLRINIWDWIFQGAKDN